MGFLTNSWVGYVTGRDAQSILNTILTKLGFRVPEMTDHSPGNPYIENLEQFAGIHEDLNYYIDNAARETQLPVARLYKSGVNKASEYNYQIIGNLPYTTDVQFELSAAPSVLVNIPADTVISNADGSILYRTVTDTDVDGSPFSGIVGAVQSEIVTNVDVLASTGASDLVVTLTDKIVHNSIKARWNSILWTEQETLAYSGPNDTHYVQTVDKSGNAIIYFGNANPTGKIPISGQALQVDYEVTLGADGFVKAGDLNTVVSSTATLPTGITFKAVLNLTDAVGGRDVETLDDLKRHIPLANRTLKRAVDEKDFEDIAELAPGISSASAVYNGKRDIDVYIVPIGGGIASSPLIASTQTYLNQRRVLGSHPVVHAAGEVHAQIVADIVVKPGYSRASTKTAVQNNLVAFMSYNSQRIKGEVNLSDLYQTIEDTEGVDNSNIKVFGILPYARPITAGTPPLIWTRTLVANTLPAQLWQIVFVSSSSFKLIRNTTLIGTYSTGVTVNTSQLQFVIPVGAYSAGNTYHFYTYPYNNNKVTLSEPSLPVSILSDLTITATGGY